jgi:hypothetical protein
VYVLDNDSTDGTAEIVREYLRHGVLAIERLPRHGVFSLTAQLRRKEQLAASLDADWFMHVDADEVHHTVDGLTLPESFARSERDGFNAVNFVEYTFVPTREHPDHDHPRFRETMRWYYPFVPAYPHRLNAWKRQAGPVDLVRSGGHVVSFEGLRMDPAPRCMRHYLFLSRAHAVRKYQSIVFDPAECAAGWHGWRASADLSRLTLPSARDLLESSSRHDLNRARPRRVHHIDEMVTGTSPARVVDVSPVGAE